MKRIEALLLGATVAMVAPTAGSAQDERLTIDQIGAPARAGAEEAVEQIAPRSRRIDAPAKPETHRASPIPQLSSGEASGRAPRQLTSEGRTVREPAQLYSGGPTAQPSTPLSRPSQGRTGAVTRVEGDDRCDAAADAPRTADCAHVIETRSAEFTRPDPTVLSPEQKLLVDQRLREGPVTARTAARRLGETGADAESEESQGVAFLVLRPAPTPHEEKPTHEQDANTAAAAAIVNAILNGGNGNPPPN